MADGKWIMNDEDARRVDLTFNASGRQNMRELPNYGQHRPIDDRDGKTEAKCAFCGSEDLQSGFGSCGEGFACRSFLCRECGGNTDFVYMDEAEKYFR